METKQSTAARIESQDLDSIKTINLIGDSQTKRHLGNAYQNVFSQDGITVNFFGKEGATHEDYLKSTELMESVKALGCSDVILIQLGDNGVSSRTDRVKEFIGILQEQCPSAKIYWAGPM